MIQIGDFSKLSRVSVKTLRYYDEMGLLRPIHVDRFTGYRYYEFDQLAQLYRTLALPVWRSKTWGSPWRKSAASLTVICRLSKCAGC